MPEEINIDRLLKTVAEQSIDKSSQVLSKMLNCDARIDLKRVAFEDVTTVTQSINESSGEVIAASIDLVGDAPFRFLFWVSVADAYKLTDLFLGQAVGTTKEFDEYTSSTVQEIGNILSSAVTNVFVANFQVAMRPEPPFVSRDYSGSIFEEFVMAVAMDRNELLLIESRFSIAECEMDCRMYLLPLAKSDEKLTFAADLQQMNISKKNIKILVIDDSASDREIMKVFLSKEGYDVVTVSGGQEGLLRMTREYFDLILCDYNMPEMNGESFIERIRGDAVLKSSIVIIITSEQEKDVKVRLLKNGANDFIHKGAAREEILARIDAHLNAKANAHAYAGAVWMDALVKVFGLLTELRADIERSPLDPKVLLEKVKQMEQTVDQVVSKSKNKY